jgi:hypothetical protein
MGTRMQNKREVTRKEEKERRMRNPARFRLKNKEQVKVDRKCDMTKR